MEVIKGEPVSAKIKEEVGAMLEKINGPAPKLAIIRVGENPDDMSYERGAVKKMDAFGLRSQCYTFPADITDEAFKKEFTAINEDPDVSGILLLRPLPKQICESHDRPEKGPGWHFTGKYCKSILRRLYRICTMYSRGSDRSIKGI